MSKTLADILGWEEGAVYRYNNRFFKIKNGLLLSSLTGKQSDWYVDSTAKVNSIFYMNEAEKVELKKYYLRHKFLLKHKLSSGDELCCYLNYHYDGGKLYLMGQQETYCYQTQFTDDEIEEIEATGFDLCNFERVEVEDD